MDIVTHEREKAGHNYQKRDDLLVGVPKEATVLGTIQILCALTIASLGGILVSASYSSYFNPAAFTTLMTGYPFVGFLCAIQILLSLIIVGLGIILAFNFIIFSKKFPLVIITGYPFWGAFTFFLTGLVTGFNEKSRQILRQGITNMNIISSVVAAIGTALILISFTQENKFCQAPSLDGTCIVGTALLLAVFLFPSEIPENTERSVSEENNQLQFEFQKPSPSSNSSSNIRTIFLGGYAFFKLRVSRNPSAAKNIPQKSDKGTSSMHAPGEQETISSPSLEEEIKLNDLPPQLKPESSKNISSQKESRSNNINDEDLESKFSDPQPKLLDNQNVSLQVLKTPSSHNALPLLHDSLSYQTLLAGLSTQALPTSKPTSSRMSQAYDLTSEDLPSEYIPFQDSTYQDMQSQDTATQDISSQYTPYLYTLTEVRLSQETPSLGTSYQELSFQDIPTKDRSSHDTPSQKTPSQETPYQDTVTLDIVSQETEYSDTLPRMLAPPNTPSQDIQYQDVLSQDRISQSTQTQNTAPNDMSFSDLQAVNSQVQTQHGQEIFYKDIRTEVMEMTQEWQSSKSKKNSRRLSLSLLGKPRQFHPKRHSLDLQQIQGYKPTKKNSVELQRKTSRRKSTDQQIKSWLSPKKHTTEKQNAYTQTSEQFLHQEADQQQAKEEEVPVQRSKDKQAKDQKSVEELYPEGHINGKEEEDQESDKEQRPEEQAQIQPAEDQQMQEQKAPESQFPNSQERQQMLLKRAPTQPCENWDSQNFQFTEKSSSYLSNPSWQPASLGSQDRRSQGWRNKDWKVQEWQFEIQPGLDWESQELLERESLRQGALHQDIQPRSTIVQHTQDHQFPNFVFQVGLCQYNDQQDSESGVLRRDTYADDVQTRDREPRDTEDTFQKPKDQKAEDERPDSYPASCQSLVPYTYVTYLSNVASEQERQNNTTPCSNSSKDLDDTSSSLFQKDQQQSEDSD
ncbi:Membrane-spanning 4-domains subfamily A member 14 [Cricetulus griseus]|uniref:Membrane-spanning 4-domains subfamily A member 14 n=1 Tax=Cricetulus griseus TaxID=10029 RepID=G3IJL7_CRIGR|nr:Membrane-spanning 4-domains subfamily A member 14 [Cricetulus griseus]